MDDDVERASDSPPAAVAGDDVSVTSGVHDDVPAGGATVQPPAEQHEEGGTVGPVDTIVSAAAARGVELSPSAANRLLLHVGGRVETAVVLLDEHPGWPWSRPDARMPSSAAARSDTRERLDGLTAPARALVAHVVVRDGLRLGEVAGLDLTDSPLALVDAGVASGLLGLRDDGTDVLVVPSGPLVASAVHDLLPLTRRDELHRAAAEASEDELVSLWHESRRPLADTRAIAARLDDLARAAGNDGQWRRAGDALVLAARLLGPTAGRALLVRAVDAVAGAGDLERAEALADELRGGRHENDEDAVLGYLAVVRGRRADAERLLGAAWDAASARPRSPENDALRAVVAQRLTLHSLAQWDCEAIASWAASARELAPAGHPAAVEAFAIEGLGHAGAGRGEQGLALYLDGDRLAGPQSQRAHLGHGWTLLGLDRPQEARAVLEMACPTAGTEGSHRITLWALACLARSQFTLGDWDGALESVARARHELDRTGLHLLAPIVHWTGAQVHALRAEWGKAEEHLRMGRAGATAYPAMVLPAAMAAASVGEARGDYEAALRALVPVLRLDPTVTDAAPGFWPWEDTYANALAALGRLDEAEDFLTPREAAARAAGHRSTQARLATARGRLLGARGRTDEAVAVLEEASTILAAEVDAPYLRARSFFVEGIVLRRAGRRRDAGRALHLALDLYEALGAQAYVVRCRRELTAGGVANPGPLDHRPDEQAASALVASLTPQELAVAQLVAAGRTNREVAAELYLSVKTIQYHLTHVYAKAGVRSRTELAAILPKAP